jgi:hypothetical protein
MTTQIDIDQPPGVVVDTLRGATITGQGTDVYGPNIDRQPTGGTTGSHPAVSELSRRKQRDGIPRVVQILCVAQQVQVRVACTHEQEACALARRHAR